MPNAQEDVLNAVLAAGATYADLQSLSDAAGSGKGTAPSSGRKDAAVTLSDIPRTRFQSRVAIVMSIHDGPTTFVSGSGIRVIV